MDAQSVITRADFDKASNFNAADTVKNGFAKKKEGLPDAVVDSSPQQIRRAESGKKVVPEKTPGEELSEDDDEVMIDSVEINLDGCGKFIIILAYSLM